MKREYKNFENNVCLKDKKKSMALLFIVLPFILL
jgi:hypothetical protein